ncbi:MAG: DNA translocase FtsK 4TM domain-containing protein, partial [Chloroflexota bacterium]
AAIGVLILAALTALGAFDLSGGVFLTVWTQMLQGLFGWGVYFAPLLLLGLGIWLILDALDKTWNLGWERPIGIGLLYLVGLMILHWLSAPTDPTRQPGAFQGGGVIGWIILSALVGAFGAIGAAFALLAALGVTLILLFNISLPEIARRAFFLARIVRNLPQELARFRAKPAAPTTTAAPPPAPSRIDYPQVPTTRAPSARSAREAVAPRPTSVTPAVPTPSTPGTKSGTPRGAMPAHIIGGDPLAATSAIPREWRLPDITQILEESTESEINQQEIRDRVHKIEETLAHFGVPAKVLEVNQGPTITQFGVEPGFVEQKGVDGKAHRVKVKVSRISALQHDLELALAAAPIRIEAPVPGKSIV